MVTLEKQLGEAIYSQINQLADRMVALQQSQRLDISPQYGLNDKKYREYGQQDLYQLAEAMIANNPPQFAGYILWQRSMLRGHSVPDFFTELQLQTEQTVLTGALAAEYHPAISRFLQAAVQALHAHVIVIVVPKAEHAPLPANVTAPLPLPPFDPIVNVAP